MRKRREELEQKVADLEQHAAELLEELRCMQDVAGRDPRMVAELAAHAHGVSGRITSYVPPLTDLDEQFVR